MFYIENQRGDKEHMLVLLDLGPCQFLLKNALSYNPTLQTCLLFPGQKSNFLVGQSYYNLKFGKWSDFLNWMQRHMLHHIGAFYNRVCSIKRRICCQHMTNEIIRELDLLEMLSKHSFWIMVTLVLRKSPFSEIWKARSGTWAILPKPRHNLNCFWRRHSKNNKYKLLTAISVLFSFLFQVNYKNAEIACWRPWWVKKLIPGWMNYSSYIVYLWAET